VDAVRDHRWPYCALRALKDPEGFGGFLVSTRSGRYAVAAKLFVGNLSYQATEEDLRELFQQAGTVQSVRIITDQFTGRPRGFGFVEMATKEEAERAIEQLNGRLFRDRNLVVNEARPQPSRSPGGPRGGRREGPGGGWGRR
jgi:cold-inducible RNA-binding protein